ncbi:hypothetical protein H4R35_004097 [Dimargaris xerosporica]|nr:hypothetical protein H4R35_004097 [Dimargaris xerosporica]
MTQAASLSTALRTTLLKAYGRTRSHALVPPTSSPLASPVTSGVLMAVRTFYKLKTHSGAKKRFRRNRHGQFRCTHASRSHLNRKLRSRSRQDSRKPLILDDGYKNHMKKLLPYAS